MKSYPNFNRYFNKSTKLNAKIVLIFFGLFSVSMFIYAVCLGEYSIGMLAYELVRVIVTIGLLLYIYLSQFNIKTARIGRTLKKKYAQGDAARAKELADELERELEAPVYSDVSNKKKYCNFVITKNWVIGSDGRNLFRANAVRLDNIKEMEKNVVAVRNRRSWVTNYFYELEIKDKDNTTYRFELRTEDSLGDAYSEVRERLS